MRANTKPRGAPQSPTPMSTSHLLVTTVLAALVSNAFASVDEEAAIALAKKSDCFKCHSVETKKEGPAYREVAKKYKGKAEAEDKLFTHVTTAPIVKVDGVEEEHQIVKTRKKDAILNLIRWILSR